MNTILGYLLLFALMILTAVLANIAMVMWDRRLGPVRATVYLFESVTGRY